MIKFRRFNLEKYDKKKHYVLVKGMERDEGVKNFITPRFVSWIDNMAKGDEEFNVDVAYVIVRDNNYIGMLGALDMSHDGIVDFWCAIDVNERKKGYGDEILGEMTLYLVENYSDVRLRIKKWNKTSKNRAIGNGYVLDEIESKEDKENDVFYYFGKKR